MPVLTTKGAGSAQGFGFAAPSAGGYRIERSLRFNSADQANLTRTPASAGNRRTWTMSFWHKTSIGSNTPIVFGAGDVGVRPSLEFGIYHNFDESRVSFLSYNGSGYDFQLRSTLSVRDPSAWYHFVVVFDTTQATNTNRIKVYINNVQITAWNLSTWPAQNFDGAINNTVRQVWSTHSFNASGDNLNGYLTEINLIDGQALTPSSFGETNAITGVWIPKQYTGTYGTNGYYLNFSDNSNTTSTTLGKDYSGNGNNWTPNNFSVTAGAGNDSLVDTPTPYGSDSGAGGEVRGNYCVWNPLAKGSDATLANGNLDVSFGSTISTTQQSATLGMSSGKWYWEVTITASSASPTFAVVGITTKQFGDSEYPGYTSTSWGYRGSDGQKWTNTSGSSYGASYTTNDVIGIAFDADAGTLTFYKNGTSQGTAYSSLAAGTYFPAIGDQSSSNTFTAATNFGQRPFAYTAPSGYKALCTQNLPTPTVVQGDDYFNTVLYSGTGSSQSITGVGFQPDFTWVKSRSAATDHGLYDAVRGVQKQLESNNSDSETTESTGLTAFGSDGFTVGALAQLNTSAATYAAWNWKANGAGSSNTQGTITATVSANQTAGFSVLTYTGNGTSGATVGHGLGATPTFLIWRRRSYLENWGVFVSAVCAYGQQLYLNFNTNLSTLGQQRITGLSSTLITFGTDNTEINASGFTYVIYAFAPIPGYSAFGSYVGNANTDGPFVYTGFRPAFILLKSSSGTATDWIILDDKRNTYNVASDILLPDTSAAEGTDQYSRTDFLSNGFKARSGGTYGFNISGTTYIYAAFAENPFKYALAR